jgi:protein-disulfide isomerase
MSLRRNARLISLGSIAIFLSTLAVLLARQFNLAPERPEPAYRTIGPADAPVQIYEYSDFSCPACSMAAGKIDEMLKIFGNGLRVTYKHYPLTAIHPWSLKAAAYADCAGEQGKFREYGAMLFGTQQKWVMDKDTPPEFKDYAVKLGLDWPKMEACAASPGTQRQVSLDMAEGDLKNVDATPTFFINGRRAVGAGQLLDEAMKFDNILRAKRGSTP